MSVEFRLRDFFYPISILRLRNFFERSQWWPQTQLQDYQEERLRQVIRHAYHHVPYYQDLFRRLKLTPEDIRGLSDLPKIPRLSKATLRREFRRLQAVDKERYHPRCVQTSGTSGEWVRFLVDKPSNVLEFVYYWRHWSWAGYRLGMRFAEFSSHYFMRQASDAQPPFHFQRGLGRLLLNSLSISADTADLYARAIRTYRPLFLKGLPSVLYYFALFLKQAGKADISFKGIFSTGEMLLGRQRRIIEETFQCKVFDSYGHMERTVAVSECLAGRLHINPEYGILELTDKQPLSRERSTGTSSCKPVFSAKVVGTSLHNFSMPLIRYEVGDIVEASEEDDSCPCGRDMPRVLRINGRQEDVITTPDGRIVTTLFIVFDEIPGIQRGQVVQEALDRLKVRVVRSLEYTNKSEENLLNYIRRFVGANMHIDLEYVHGEVLNPGGAGKFRAVISNLKRPSEMVPVV
jgi:phenylacetate-CoA ligase